MAFYTEERLSNWVNRINEEKIDFENAESFEVFDKMIEDFVVACLHLVRSVKNRELNKKEALKEIEEVYGVFNIEYTFNDEFKGEFFDFAKESMRIILESTKLYLQGKSSKKDFNSLLSQAIKKEKEGDLNKAFEILARMGAKVIGGEKLPEFDISDEELVLLNWLDGIDAINTVMLLSEIDISEIGEEGLDEE
ncbi:Uncharacterized protein conserved in archaea [Archaeoglobus sulfaticallidus PM70-1]|uniref:Uncharacterized protein conserved in archaea n=1 Tax=Archaeoglobus sulfaticallidus PM70-1 TaxID=387631 RepID=N0BBR0_9EURY|nr:DUF2150 family protein [Archaeoglobus sulfaticallidus]AGK61024.1 Uncharacterized protein conserved in archaea [Archaeoglobus sulfaticallidus PM70-1]